MDGQWKMGSGRREKMSGPPPGITLKPIKDGPPPGITLRPIEKHPIDWRNADAATLASKGIWQPASTGTKTVSTGQTGQESKLGRFMEGANKIVLEALPAIGMTAGGIAGAPGLVTGGIGAGAGAGLGKIAQDVLEEKEGIKPKATPGEEAKGIAEQTALGVGSDVGGGLAMKGAEKAAAAMAPKLGALADRIMAGIIRPSARRLIAGQGRAETARQVAHEVASVAGSATTLSKLSENVSRAIDDITAKTESIVNSYKPGEIEVPVSDARKPSGAKQITGGTELVPPRSIAVPEPKAAGQPAAKMFVRQGGINLNRILQRSAKMASENLSDTEFPDKTNIVRRAVKMIARHAGKSDLTPSEALSLRRWLRRDMKWPRSLNGLRDEVYAELNRQIGSFLSPEDRALFEANNAKVHRLLIGKDAIDSAMHRHLVNPINMTIHGGMGGWIGYEAGGKPGAIAGAAIGAATGTIPFQLGEAGAIRTASKLSSKTADVAAMPWVRQTAKTLPVIVANRQNENH